MPPAIASLPVEVRGVVEALVQRLLKTERALVLTRKRAEEAEELAILLGRSMQHYRELALRSALDGAAPAGSA